MFIKSIIRYKSPTHKVITNWGKKTTMDGQKFIGIENHYINNTLLSKRYIIASDTNKVVVKDKNLFGTFDKRA